MFRLAFILALSVVLGSTGIQPAFASAKPDAPHFSVRLPTMDWTLRNRDSTGTTFDRVVGGKRESVSVRVFATKATHAQRVSAFRAKRKQLSAVRTRFLKTFNMGAFEIQESRIVSVVRGQKVEALDIDSTQTTPTKQITHYFERQYSTRGRVYQVLYSAQDRVTLAKAQEILDGFMPAPGRKIAQESGDSEVASGGDSGDPFNEASDVSAAETADVYGPSPPPSPTDVEATAPVAAESSEDITTDVCANVPAEKLRGSNFPSTGGEMAMNCLGGALVGVGQLFQALAAVVEATGRTIVDPVYREQVFAMLLVMRDNFLAAPVVGTTNFMATIAEAIGESSREFSCMHNAARAEVVCGLVSKLLVGGFLGRLLIRKLTGADQKAIQEAIRKKDRPQPVDFKESKARLAEITKGLGRSGQPDKVVSDHLDELAKLKLKPPTGGVFPRRQYNSVVKDTVERTLTVAMNPKMQAENRVKAVESATAFVLRNTDPNTKAGVQLRAEYEAIMRRVVIDKVDAQLNDKTLESLRAKAQQGIASKNEAPNSGKASTPPASEELPPNVELITPNSPRANP